MMTRTRPSLRQGIDRDVYSIVRRLEDEHQDSSAPPARLTVLSVFDSIKRSNSSLARQKRRPLEDSIARVLEIRQDEIKADEIDGDSDEAIEAAATPPKSDGNRSERDSSLLNRQLTKHWNFSGGWGPPKRDPQVDRMDVDGPANGEPKRKRPRSERPAKPVPDRSPPTDIDITDVAGMDDILKRLESPVLYRLLNGAIPGEEAFCSPNAVLIHGPSGCGKTMLVKAMAKCIGVSFVSVRCQSVVSGTSGESEKNIREYFDEAVRLAPCLLFLDEIDTIAGKIDGASKAMEGRMLAEITDGMDRTGRASPEGHIVVIVATTSRPDSLYLPVRRRFADEMEIGMPNQEAREAMLRTMTRKLTLAPDVDFKALAKLTPGFVGGDLVQVVKKATCNDSRAASHVSADEERAQGQDAEPALSSGWRRVRASSAGPEPSNRRIIAFDDFRKAMALVEPAAKREGFSAIPDTTWSHVGALKGVRESLEMSIIGPITKPKLYAQVGIKPAAGILLWGPPGCGKTLVAKAVANESKANFISIKGPEILSKWVGESEKAVRQLFSRARASAPCILFFDEMDALAPKRDESLAESSARVVNALLTELDGVGDRSGVYVIGATNRPDIIDPAIRRPGRLGTSIFVGLPTPEDRADILQTLFRNQIRRPSPVDLGAVAMDRRCDGFSGADLGSLLQAAGRACLKRACAVGMPGGEALEDGMLVTTSAEDWEVALNEVKPSVSDMHRYDELAE